MSDTTHRGIYLANDDGTGTPYSEGGGVKFSS